MIRNAEDFQHLGGSTWKQQRNDEISLVPDHLWNTHTEPPSSRSARCPDRSVAG